MAENKWDNWVYVTPIDGVIHLYIHITGGVHLVAAFFGQRLYDGRLGAFCLDGKKNTS